MNSLVLTSKTLMPKIMWYQTDVTVVIRVLLQDVNKYFLRVTNDYLLFSTKKDGKDYCLCLYLFGALVPEKTTHKNLCREIKIVLIKAHKWTGWLRLQADKDKNSLIVLDPDHLYETDWTKSSLARQERESFEEYKRRNNITNIKPVVPSSDEEDSDDETMDQFFLICN